MKRGLIVLLFIITNNVFSQNLAKNEFLFLENQISYSRLDYSKHGVSRVYITMYVDTPENNLMDLNAISCLSIVSNLYHTLYYFVKIPQTFKQEEKEKLFTAFVKLIKEKEKHKIKKALLVLNFDGDYTNDYAIEKQNNLELNNVAQLYFDTKNQNICNRLLN